MEKGEEGQQESSRVPGRPGRPRIERSNDNALQTRRKQIRDAQRTYRLKKEARAQALEARCEELETKTKNMMEAFSKIYETTSLSGLKTTNHELANLIQDAASHFGIQGTEFSNDPQGSNEANTGAEPTGYDNMDLPSDDHNQLSNIDPGDEVFTFGYSVPHAGTETTPALNPEPTSEVATTPGPIAPSQGNFWNEQAIHNYVSSQALLGEGQARLNNTVHSYSFLETNFARRIHRNCLEHFYRIFDDPASDPTSVYRVFRLVACIQDRAKMKPYFQNLLRRPAGGLLEISGQPFYCIGGAGKHYPRKDDIGSPIYPSNMRLPKRILGFVSNNTALMSPFVDEGYEEFLCQRGYGGEWFDPQDVEGYLCSKGIVLSAQSSIVKVLGHDTPASIIQSPPLSAGAAISPETEGSQRPTSSPTCIFDADYFLDCLCQKGVVLGRIPGFRKADIDQAIARSLRYSVRVF